MTFEQRNEAWDGTSVREFRQTQTRSSSPRTWKCWVKGSTIFCQWGRLGGAIQEASEISLGVNHGKKNFISPENYALYLAREKCRKKNWEGYREVDGSGVPVDELVTEIDFSNPPLNLAFWKPDNSPGAGMMKKAEAGKVIYVRKMNGLMYCVWCNEKGDVFLTTRRMLRQHDDEVSTQYTWNDRFPHIIKELKEVMPPKSCLLGELVAYNGHNKDDLHLVESYTKSLTPRALEDQARNRWAWLYVWGVAFWNGQNYINNVPLGAQYELIKSIVPQSLSTYIISPQIIKPGEIAGYTLPEHFRELAKNWGWEGFVMVDPEEPLGDRGMNFKGKPDRPSKIAAKIKPEYEDDFVVFWDPEKGYGDYSSKGRYGGKGMKSATLWQYNSNGELVYIANVASGLTEEIKTKATPSMFPQVWRVVYTSRRYKSDGADTNALDFPRVDESVGIVRTDKRPEECVNPKL